MLLIGILPFPFSRRACGPLSRLRTGSCCGSTLLLRRCSTSNNSNRSHSSRRHQCRRRREHPHRGQARLLRRSLSNPSRPRRSLPPPPLSPQQRSSMPTPNQPRYSFLRACRHMFGCSALGRACPVCERLTQHVHCAAPSRRRNHTGLRMRCGPRSTRRSSTRTMRRLSPRHVL